MIPAAGSRPKVRRVLRSAEVSPDVVMLLKALFGSLGPPFPPAARAFFAALPESGSVRLALLADE